METGHLTWIHKTRIQTVCTVIPS